MGGDANNECPLLFLRKTFYLTKFADLHVLRAARDAYWHFSHFFQVVLMSARALLSERQQSALQTFRDVTALEDDDLCISILANHAWNVDEAVTQFMGGGQEVEYNRAPGAAYRRPNAGSSSSAGAGAGAGAGAAANSGGRGNNPPPIGAAAAGAGSRRQAPPQGNALDAMLQPLKWLFRVQPPQDNPTQDARKFVTEFDATYHPNNRAEFCNDSYQVAVQQAFQSSKFLVVYLHSPMHEDTAKFCRQSLCTRNVTMVLNEHAVTWAGSVWAQEGYELSSQLRVSSFPFVAVLVCESARQVKIVDRIQGYLDEQPLTERLENCMRSNSHELTEVRLTAARQRESSELRAQQDREFRDMEESQRRENERRAREGQERRAREEDELLQAQIAERESQVQRELRETELKRKKEALKEPDNGPDVATIRFQMPTGAKVVRRFARSSTLQQLCDYLDVHFAETASSTSRFAVSSHFPKVELTDMSATVEQMVRFLRLVVTLCASLARWLFSLILLIPPRPNPLSFLPPGLASPRNAVCARP